MSGGDRVAATIDRILALPPEERGEAIRHLSDAQRREFLARWDNWAQAGQRAPPGDWRVWLIRAGRGFGKTRAGAEWVCALAAGDPTTRIALVGETIDDVRRVMVEGPSGVIAVTPALRRPEWNVTAGQVRWPNGATAYVYGARAPEKLRGPEHSAAWCDELGKWGHNGEAAWDNLLLGLRLGERPRAVVTTTPRPTALMRRVMALPTCVETRGASHDNIYLPDGFVLAMAEQYGGTRLGRQELDGELLDDVAGALWPRDLIEACRVREPPALVRVVVGVDPPAGIGGDACGIVATGLGADGRGYVLEDASVVGTSPEGWARAVAACVARWNADRVVAEKNMGGEMVRATLIAADAAMPITLVSATQGKTVRAEPVAALYETGRVKHAGAFPALEDELAGLSVGGGYEGPGRSPDRADALVWALTALLLARRGVAKVRGV